MPNPAAELFTIFTNWRSAPEASTLQRRELAGDDPAGIATHARAFKLLEQIERSLAELAQAGRRVGVAQRACPLWAKAILAIPTDSWAARTNASDEINQQLMDILDQLADTLDLTGRPAISHSSKDDALQELRDVLEAVNADDSLDPRLKRHIRRVVRNLQTCIEDFDGSDEDGIAALDAVWAAMQAAMSQSSDPGIWEKFRDRFVVPTTVGWLVSAPAVVQGITAAQG